MPRTPPAPAVSTAPSPPPSPAADLPARRPARALLGPRPLIAGEDGSDYDDIRLRLIADVMPEDFIEEIWARNVVDLVWESIRLRRLKAQLMQAAAHEGLEEVLAPLFDSDDAEELARKWAGGDEAATREVEEALGRASLTVDAVMAQTLAIRIDDFERIDRMITVAEARRDAVLREIARHRAAFGHALRRAGQEAVDAAVDAAVEAEFADVAPRTELRGAF
jgi:hypothetical protein